MQGVCCGCCKKACASGRRQRPKPVDVRVLFATNRDLERMCKRKNFARICTRIHVVEIHLPALRERGDDVPRRRYFLGLFAARYKREKKTVSRDACGLQAYGWPATCGSSSTCCECLVMSEGPRAAARRLRDPRRLPPRHRSLAQRAAPAQKGHHLAAPPRRTRAHIEAGALTQRSVQSAGLR